MNGTWKDLFTFNKRERNGIVVLTFLISVTALIQLAVPLFVPKYENPNPTEDKLLLALIKEDSILRVEKRKEIQGTKILNSKKKFASEKKIRSDSKELRLVWNPIHFDPNTKDFSVWENFGLSSKQAESIKKYVNSGAEFKVKRDVNKLFVINDDLFRKMEPFILLPDSLSKNSYSKYAERKITTPSNTRVFAIDSMWIELNTTDTAELKKLRGIGSYYARQIIWYRDKLGGFHSVNQLYEIERMRPETVQKIRSFVWVDSSMVKKFQINSSTAPEMVKHPYITWNMAITIQDYRDFTKKFKRTHQLVDLGLLNEEIYSKLAPYLEL